MKEFEEKDAAGMDAAPETEPAVKTKKKKTAEKQADNGGKKETEKAKKSGKAPASRKKEPVPPEKKEIQAEELMNGVHQLVSQAKDKDGKLDVDEINDFFVDYNLSAEEIEQIYAFLEASSIEVLNESAEEEPPEDLTEELAEEIFIFNFFQKFGSINFNCTWCFEIFSR